MKKLDKQSKIIHMMPICTTQELFMFVMRSPANVEGVVTSVFIVTVVFTDAPTGKFKMRIFFNITLANEMIVKGVKIIPPEHTHFVIHKSSYRGAPQWNSLCFFSYGQVIGADIGSAGVNFLRASISLSFHVSIATILRKCSVLMKEILLSFGKGDFCF